MLLLDWSMPSVRQCRRSRCSRQMTKMQQSATLQEYRRALTAADAAACESAAVSQHIAGRHAVPHAGYATKVFTRICAHAMSLMRAAPLSRWVRSDFEVWDLSSIAAQGRAIFEGHLLLEYVARPPDSDDEWSARLNIMHLNDCSRRVKLMGYLGATESIDVLLMQANELRERLRSNQWFAARDSQRQKTLLTGDSLMAEGREALLARVGWDKDQFHAMWLLLSQHVHILPLSFYRMEANGRGTGVQNDTDIGYIRLTLDLCAQSIAACTDSMVKLFPDAASVRKGSRSKFSPGPSSNRPRPSRSR